MSIYVSISRRRYPLEEGGAEISAEEWLHVIQAEGDFRLHE